MTDEEISAAYRIFVSADQNAPPYPFKGQIAGFLLQLADFTAACMMMLPNERSPYSKDATPLIDQFEKDVRELYQKFRELGPRTKTNLNTV